MKHRQAVVVSLIVIGLGGCATNGPNETAGRFIGGAMGGAIGSQVGEGTGRTAAIIGGTLLGSQVGGNVGRSVDRTEAEDAYRYRRPAYRNRDDRYCPGC